MAAISTSRAAFKAKSLGLRVNTNLPPTDFQSASPSDEKSSHKNEIFAQLATAPPQKVRFSAEVDTINPGKLVNSTPKTSGALLSTDWRKDCRQQGPPPTAPAKKVLFSNEEIKPKKPKIDTSADTNYGLRRYRDTPVNPDFIHSAPATKSEFDIIRDDDSDDDGYDIDEDEDDDHLFFQPPQNQTAGFKQTSQNNLVQLKQIISLPKGTESTTTPDSGSTPMSPYFMISPVYDTNGFKFEFPVAQIQAVKNGKRFQTRPWDDLDSAVKQKLSELEVPRTAGLPVEAMRREYKQRQAEAEAEQQKANETIRFNALIEKLQQKHRKATADTGNTRRPSIIDIKPPFWTKEAEKKEEHTDEAGQKSVEQRRPSQDSAISGFSDDGDKKLSILNPNAPEFSISPVEDSPKTTVIVSVEQFKDMCARLKRIEAELAMEKLQRTDPFSASEPNPSSGDFTLGALNPNMDLSSMVQPLPITSHAPPQDQASQPPLPQHVEKYLERYPNGHVPLGNAYYFTGPQINGTETVPQPPPPVALQAQQNGVGIQRRDVGIPNYMPPATSQQTPIYVHDTLAAGPPMQLGNPAIYPGGPSSFASGPPPQVPHMGMPVSAYPIGPKPVRKPKGPFREGDLRQSMHQQQYEAYLKWKRSTNVDYAKACKTRQARRAERNKPQQV
ncbi:hypothetical protein SLS62_009045 [Diatrype stigma]|uniref:Uncharacterized protein n=1 Tax=Diatrype stigma TaxID=117547 RepID=A0AAN9YM22_9PEZI